MNTIVCKQHETKSWECELCVADAMIKFNPILRKYKESNRQAALCVLGGKKCRSQHICNPSYPIWDHVALYNFKGKPAAIQLQPYTIDGAAMAELQAALVIRGLEMYISAHSNWYPGNTISIWIYSDKALWREIVSEAQLGC